MIIMTHHKKNHINYILYKVHASYLYILQYVLYMYNIHRNIKNIMVYFNYIKTLTIINNINYMLIKKIILVIFM